MTIFRSRRRVADLLRTGAAAALLCALLGACGSPAPPASGPGAAAENAPPPVHELLLSRYGGPYDDPALAAYVAEVGARVLAVTEAAGRPFAFTVLDSGAPNAFAEPNGHVYVTRGLLSLMTSEAELAAVLAHEIAHLTAGHPAQRSAQVEEATRPGRAIATSGGDPALARAVMAGAAAQLLRYGRAQELEADAIGVRYAALAGYDPGGMARFLTQLSRDESLRTRTGSVGRAPEFLSTHPSSVERIDHAVAVAATAPGRPGDAGRDRFLLAIEGLPWGDDDGFVIDGRTVASRTLGAAVTVPRGWSLQVIDGEVLARHATGAVALVGWEPAPDSVTPTGYLSRTVPADAGADVETLEINGFGAATTVFRADSRHGPLDVRLLAARVDPRHLALITFLSPLHATRLLDRDMRAIAYSLEAVPPESLAPPLRIEVATVRPGDTVRSMAARMATDHAVERFLALNGLERGAPLEPWQLVKLLVR